MLIVEAIKKVQSNPNVLTTEEVDLLLNFQKVIFGVVSGIIAALFGFEGATGVMLGLIIPVLLSNFTAPMLLPAKFHDQIKPTSAAQHGFFMHIVVWIIAYQFVAGGKISAVPV